MSKYEEYILHDGAVKKSLQATYLYDTDGRVYKVFDYPGGLMVFNIHYNRSGKIDSISCSYNNELFGYVLLKWDGEVSMKRQRYELGKLIESSQWDFKAKAVSRLDPCNLLMKNNYLI